MTRIAPLVAFIVLLTATAGAGYFQGSLTNRFGAQQCAKDASEQLKIALPAQCGSWHLRDEMEMAPEVCRMLQYPTYLQRDYVHVQTGDVATVFVIVGHPGPVSVHTPEVCYSSKDFVIDGARRKITVELPSQPSHDLWELTMKPRNEYAGLPLRVFYAWSTGTKWEAAQHPRFGYGGLPHLYKLQMSVSTRPGSESKDFDPAQDFLKSFLSDLQPRLVEATRRSGSSS